LFPFGELVKPKIYQNLVWITRKFDLLGGCMACEGLVGVTHRRWCDWHCDVY